MEIFAHGKEAKNGSSWTTELNAEKCEKRLRKEKANPENSPDANKRICAPLKEIITRRFSQFTQEVINSARRYCVKIRKSLMQSSPKRLSRET